MIHPQDIEPVTKLHDAFGLSAKEALVLLLLTRGSVVRAEKIRDVYCDYPERTSPIEARSAVKRVRKKAGVKIQNVYGIGYELEPKAKMHIRNMLRGAQ